MARPGESYFTPRYKEPWQEMLDDLNLHPKPMEKECHGGMGSIGGFTYPYWDTRVLHVGESGGGFPKREAPRTFRTRWDTRDRFYQTKGPKNDIKMRPTSLQKFSKRFNGMGDPCSLLQTTYFC